MIFSSNNKIDTTSKQDKIIDWDSYWRKKIKNIDTNCYCSDIRPLSSLLPVQMISTFRKRGSTDILFIGNGIDQTPRALAFAGFQVLALDVSSVATEYAKHFGLSEAEHRLFFQVNPHGDKVGGDHSAEYFFPGGNVRFEQGDFLDAKTASGPFGGIIASRCLQNDVFTRIDEAIDAINRRLTGNGCVCLTIQNHAEQWDVFENRFRDLGYQINPMEYDGTARILVGGIGSG